MKYYSITDSSQDNRAISDKKKGRVLVLLLLVNFSSFVKLKHSDNWSNRGHLSDSVYLRQEQSYRSDNRLPFRCNYRCMFRWVQHKWTYCTLTKVKWLVISMLKESSQLVRQIDLLTNERGANWSARQSKWSKHKHNAKTASVRRSISFECAHMNISLNQIR